MTERTIIKAERKAKAIDLLGGKCVKCGGIERLEFDHINNDRASYNRCLARILPFNSWENILEELGKCQLLCRICHQHKSLLERGYDVSGRHGLASTYKNGCRCSECRAVVALYSRECRRKKQLLAVK
jgi:hypothetical protein